MSSSSAADEPLRGAAPSTVHAGLADRLLRIETPEHVALQLPLAGPGSRFAALLIDLALIVLLLVAGPLLLVALTGFAGDDLAGSLVVLWGFAVVWGYFFAYEAFRDGQTPGKRRLGIRAVLVGGYPLTLEAAAIRNLIRMLDIQGGGLLGGFVMLVTRRSQRLGDLAAGTVVVRELPAEFPQLPGTATSAGGAPLLSDATFVAVELYLARRAALPRSARGRLHVALLGSLPDGARPQPGQDVDRFLEQLHTDEEARRRAAALTGRLGTAAAARLLAAKRERWTEFQDAVRRLRRSGLRSLVGEEVRRFAARYRELSADLARARTYGASVHTLWALERVVGAAHNLFYRPARRSLRRARGFLARGFPRLVRRRWRPILLAGLLLYGPGVVSYTWLRAHPEAEARLVSAEMIMRAEEASERRASGKGYIDIPLSAGSVVSTQLITNNVQVSFLAFAGGVLAGVFTALLLAFNGLHLGAALALFANRGALDVIGTFVLAHGVLELSAIVIAGGAGLWMGSAWILPGRQTRLAALTARGAEAVGLILGVAAMLVVAGLIEAFVSPSELPAVAKLTISAMTAVLLVAYLLGCGRGADADGNGPA